jgi:hypothetical protein
VTREAFLGILGRDSAGLFWIAAELVILFLVLSGRRTLQDSPPSASFSIFAVEKRRVWRWILSFAALVVATLGRHVVVLPLYVLVPEVAVSTPDHILSGIVAKAYHTRALLDAGVWAAFITIWVALEILIVWHGWKLAKRLRELLTLKAAT